ncbi:hypothetical protein HELRODRAFT_64352 [Helobdella robusta]|uniref:cyclin-dependent kinase n=1 Tax=Helobdella robusta TaxID=6412 RepID=T1FXT3_HELRO|nr:hypothetical protein HELRODRAFT_64352 [Helobdella robusta]ESO06520.1 hypothetical protein HELRODRAFT_64352 [Helobdella robusta]
MEKYVKLGFLGEGSYGLVSKCRNVESGQTVAIKKFPDSDRDKAVKKIAMREIKMLKQLNHDNLVNLLEVFNHKKKIYLVFEFLEKSVADELENHLTGMIEPEVRGIMWQVLRGLKFCHDKNVLHRDIKPENILMSKSGIVKLCDFGFARTLNHPDTILTDYVATRWYRAPELLVGEVRYGRSVDIWSIGCVAGELLSGEPVFAGNSDLDQLFVIVKCLGNLTPHLEEIYTRNDIFRGTKLPHVSKWQTLQERYKHNMTEEAIDFLDKCLQMNANDRPSCQNLLISSFFTKTDFHLTFPKELQAIIEKENGSRMKRSDKKHHRKMVMKSYIDEKYSNESVVNMNKYPLDNHRVFHAFSFNL